MVETQSITFSMEFPAIVATETSAPDAISPFTKPHDKFIDCIIDNLFQKNIDSIIRVGSVTQTANVHARTQPDVFKGT